MGCSSSISVTEPEEQINETQSAKSEYYIEKLTHISADISEVAFMKSRKSKISTI